jgi:hypothetical protein
MHRMKPNSPQALALAAVVLAAGLSGCATGGQGDSAPVSVQPWTTTKTPYRPRQPLSAYEAPPAGFKPVHTQLVARHGARGLTSMKHELALLNLWRAAAEQGALTPLGQGLGPDLETLIRANALLGAGVDGISRPGYGNLSQTGIAEHQGLAQRVLARMPALFDGSDEPGAPDIVVLNSGVDRAHDSAVFFTRALLAERPALAPLVNRPVLRDYPEGAPRAQAPGTNRFLLYFHKLNAKTDAVSNPADPAQRTYQRSLAYQAQADNAEVAAKLAAVHEQPTLQQAARTVLLRLFSPAFVERLAQGQLAFSNTGSFEFSAPDGRFKTRLTGDGKATIDSPLDALLALSGVDEIAPGLSTELGGLSFRRYLGDEAAALLAQANDAEDFYVKGPGIAELQPINHAMAGQLLDDFFDQAEAAAAAAGAKPGAAAPVPHRANFRFTHAEILIPFATLLGMAGADLPVPRAALYSHASNPWRGEQVAPYAANVQWDTWRNAQGQVLVRMLYNEGQAHFKPACAGAQIQRGSYFYALRQLRACYRGG